VSLTQDHPRIGGIAAATTFTCHHAGLDPPARDFDPGASRNFKFTLNALAASLIDMAAHARYNQITNPPLPLRGLFGMTGMARSKDEVIARLVSAKSRILRLGIRRLALFGSFARDEAAPDSDVDILVEFDPSRKTYDNFLELSELLEELLQRPVEVITIESLSPYIGPHIIAEAVDVIRAA
jgi:hypothetical protein